MVKVRWNAAYAAGQILASASEAGDPESATAVDDIIHALAEAVELCDNFKVRIAAAAAMATVTDRNVLGEKFKPLLVLLLRYYFILVCLMFIKTCFHQVLISPLLHLADAY
jgi:HEAT repeat protein